MRIRQIDVCDFRAFLGPTKYHFNLGEANNLFIFGENGAGKSSLFHAIREFFNLDSKAKPFSEYKNIFSDAASSDGVVALHFDDGGTGEQVDWKITGDRPSKNPTVAGTAIRMACVDYRDLLRTNFVHDGDVVNLFDLTVNHLLRHYPVSAKGTSVKTVGGLWRRVLQSKPATRHRRLLDACKAAVEDFNQTFAPIIPALAAKAEELLADFPGGKFDLNLTFPKVTYDEVARMFSGRELRLEIGLNGRALISHHHFLNEARLSSIALAIYFAGLLISIPPTPPGAPRYPSVLVLDDVLIGLDMSNRIPVLDLLRKHFADWQIFLFTYDKVWHEIVRLQTQEDPSWCYHELYIGEAPGGFEIPVQRPENKGWDYFLARARSHLAANDERAAAVYARAAFESKLKNYCHKLRVPVQYDHDPRRLTADAFWQAAKQHALKLCATDAIKEAALQSMYHRVETYRKIVLNPLSHSAAAAITKAEIQGAIDEVAKMQF
jgi:hypothetical protein